MEKITEMPGKYRALEKRSIAYLTKHINREDQGVAEAVHHALPQLNLLIERIEQQLRSGGRLFYVGAGSGGRLSVLDVIELPTTYGIEKGIFNVILAGGVDRLADALEEKEDDPEAGWQQLKSHDVNTADIVVGISASGTTPFVLGALTACKAHRIPTGSIVSNPGTPIAAVADLPVEVITGPEFVTGSTRMKCGTAQKMIFDIISTTVMIRLGRVVDNKMVNVRLINQKITDRAVRILMEQAAIPNYDEARALLLNSGTIMAAKQHWDKQKS